MKKILKGAGLTILILAIIYLALCLFGPSDFKLERSTVINASAAQISPYLGDLKYFKENWSPWTEKDPNMTCTYEGESGKVGHKYSWSGNKEVGVGYMRIDSINENRVVMTLFFEGMDESKVWLNLSPDEKGTKVSWGMSGDIFFPFRAMMLFVSLEKQITPDYDKGLASLKKLMESLPVADATPAYTITETDWTEHLYFGKKATVAIPEVGKFFQTNTPLVMEMAGKAKVAMTGSPAGIYFTWDDQKTMTTDCACVFPADLKTKEVKGLEKFACPAAKAIVTDYYGPNENMMSAHTALMKYIEEKKLTMNYVVEEYMTDRSKEADSTKWLTKIWYILK